MTVNYSEQYVLANCLHNPLAVLEKTFFPMFQESLTVKIAPKVCGYHTAIVHQQPVTFEQWAQLRYKELRQYPSIEEQLDYIYHNGEEAWRRDIIDPVKAAFPKP